MRILLFFSVFLVSCNSSSNNQASKIQYINSIVNDYSQLIHRVVTDTTYLKDDTIYTHYEYDKPIKLLSIHIEETATNNKYISYVTNDTLIKIVLNNRNPNYSSDQTAAYYIDNDIVIKKEETRDKLEDIQKFISAQKRNIQFFKDTLGTHL